MILGSNRACNGFRVGDKGKGKTWLKMAFRRIVEGVCSNRCIIVSHDECKRYPGMFTFYFSHFNAGKRLSNVLIHQLNFSVPNRTAY